MTALARVPLSLAYPLETAMTKPAKLNLVIALPDDERGRGEFDLRELDRINARLLANAYRARGGQTAEQLRDADLTRREELEGRPRIKADQRWIREAAEETEALARGRGESVTEDKSGVKRILDRDPLLSLARASKITPEQLEAGQVIREAYERRGEDAGSVEFTGMPGSAHDHERFVASRFTRAKATILIGQVTTAILTGRFRTAKGYTRQVDAFGGFKAQGVQTHDALTMLRAVCGEGKSLSSQGEGRAFARNATALALALDVAEEVIGAR